MNASRVVASALDHMIVHVLLGMPPKSITLYASFSEVEMARCCVPDIEVASDFIVGLSGETEEDFRAPIELVGWTGFKN